MAFNMKYTNGKKADVSAFPFKIESGSAVSDSLAKLDLKETAGKKVENLGYMGGGGVG